MFINFRFNMYKYKQVHQLSKRSLKRRLHQNTRKITTSTLSETPMSGCSTTMRWSFSRGRAKPASTNPQVNFALSQSNNNLNYFLLTDNTKLQFVEMGEILKLVMDVVKKPHVETEEEVKYFMKRVPQCFR